MCVRTAVFACLVVLASVSAYSDIRVDVEGETVLVHLAEPIGHAWRDELVFVDVPWPKGRIHRERIEVAGPDDNPVPFQFDAAKFATDGTLEAARLGLLVDLGPHATSTFRITQAESPKRFTSPLTYHADDKSVLIGTKNFSLKLRLGEETFDSPQPLREVPAPFESVMGINRIPRGSSRFGSPEKCLGYSLRLVERGPLRAIYEASYRLERENVYRQRWTVVAGRPVVSVDEEANGQSLRGNFYLSLYSKLWPTRVLSDAGYPFPAGRSQVLGYTENRAVGTIPSHRSGQDSSRWVGLYHNDAGFDEMFVLSRARGGSWSGRPLYVMQFGGADPDLALMSPLTVKRRHWLLAALKMSDKADWPAVYPNIAAWPERYGLPSEIDPQSFLTLSKVNGLHLAAQTVTSHYNVVSLDRALHEVTRWQRSESTQRPSAWLDTAQLGALREKIEKESVRPQWVRVESSLAEAVGRPGRVDREAVRRLEDRALVAAVRQDATMTATVLGEIDAALGRKIEDLLLFGPDFPAELDAGSLGEVLSVSIRAYDLISGDKILDVTRRESLEARMAFLAFRLLDRDLFPYADADTPQGDFDEFGEPTLRGSEARNAHRYAALVDFSRAFPSHPSASRMMEHAHTQLRLCLNDSVAADGALVEAPGAMNEVVKIWLRLANSIPETRWNLFLEPTFRRMCLYLSRLHTPPMASVGLPSALPGIGEGGWRNDGPSVLGAAAAGFQRTDPALAGELQWVWRRGHDPNRPSLGYTDWLIYGDETIAAVTPKIGSHLLGNSGALLRHRAGTERETYVIGKAGADDRRYQHDEGAFSLIWHGIPITLDPGTDSRDPGIAARLASTEAHNVVRFGNRENVAIPSVKGIERRRGRVALLAKHDRISGFAADLSNATPSGTWLRALLLIDDAYLLILDAIDSPKAPPSWLLHTFAESFRVRDEGRGVLVPGPYGAQLGIRLVGASHLEFDRVPAFLPDFEKYHRMAWTFPKGKANVLAVLRPFDLDGEPPLFEADYTDGVLRLNFAGEETTVRGEFLESFLQRGELPQTGSTIQVSGEEGDTVLSWQTP